MSLIHPSAVIEPGAEIGQRVRIGPYCCVGKDVILGSDVHLISHVTLSGHTTVGKGTVVYPFASLGHAPQDLKYRGEPSCLHIGQYNKIREYVTMQPGTEGGGMVTRIGDHGLFMAGSHVAHDCLVGHRVILANNATLGGHVVVGDDVVIGGLAAVHQFVRIGAHAMIGGTAGVAQDVIPYGCVTPYQTGQLVGLNMVGLRRRNFSRDEIRHLKTAYNLLMKEKKGTLEERLTQLPQDLKAYPTVQQLVSFMQEKSLRSFCFDRSDGDEF